MVFSICVNSTKNAELINRFATPELIIIDSKYASKFTISFNELFATIAE